LIAVDFVERGRGKLGVGRGGLGRRERERGGEGGVYLLRRARYEKGWAVVWRFRLGK